MAEDVRMALAGLLRKTEADPSLDVLREGVRVLAEALMATEVERHLGAARYERPPERTGQRNGHRDRDGSRAPGRSAPPSRWSGRSTSRASRRGGWTT
jgi:transposase-like protein